MAKSDRYNEIEERYPGISTRIWTVGAVMISVSTFSIAVETALSQANVPEMIPTRQEPWLLAAILMGLAFPATFLFTLVVGHDTYRLSKLIQLLDEERTPPSQGADLFGAFITVLFGGIAAVWGGACTFLKMLSMAFPGLAVNVAKWLFLDPSRFTYFTVTVYCTLFATLAFKARPVGVFKVFIYLLLCLSILILLLLWIELFRAVL